MTQNERILRHLHDYRCLTSYEAMNEYGIMRLASRVHELRRNGYHIESKTVNSMNRYKEPIHFAVYKLGD